MSSRLKFALASLAVALVVLPLVLFPLTAARALPSNQSSMTPDPVAAPAEGPAPPPVMAAAAAIPVAPQSQGSYEAPTGARIDKIEIVGNQRIEAQTILTYLDVKTGDQMTDDTFNKALKSLFNTGLFSDIGLKENGNTLVVNVAENPIINKIAFEGNDKIKDEDLLNEIQLRPRQVFSRSKVEADVNRLYQLYRRQGRFSVTIQPKAIKLDQNRINLVFEIDEGPVTKVATIRFIGNNHYSTDKLQAEIATKESYWYRFLSTNDRYDPDRLAYDQELLRKFYLSQGYADFDVVSATAELSKDRERFFITFTLNEGERYKISDVNISSSLRGLDPKILYPTLTLHKGDWYNATEAENDVTKLVDQLSQLQFPFVNVRTDMKRDRVHHTAALTFDVSEGPHIFVERIDIHGNVRTLDKVIRRQMLLAEGDPLNKQKMAKSEQNIKDLDYFETVKVTSKPGSSPDRNVIDVDLTEKSTGELSIGAGFSTAEGPLADTSIKEHNLLGKGQDLGLSGTIAGKYSEIDLSFTEPYFLDRDFATGFDLYHTTTDLLDESNYDQKKTGGDLRVAYPLADRWRQTVRYTLEQNDIYNVSSDASVFIKDQEGTNVTSAFSQEITYDGRDSKLFPTNGLYSWLDTEVAGAGGDSRFVSGKIGSSYYYPIADKWVFNILGETGAIEGYGGHDVRIDERFFLGDTTFRGFKLAGIGPRDVTTDDALGGNYFYRGTAELSFPIGLPDELGILGHAFNDIGSVWGLDNLGVSSHDVVKDQAALRASAGVGISWRSPLGPIRVNLAMPYLKQSYDKDEVFQFDFGTHF